MIPLNADAVTHMKVCFAQICPFFLIKKENISNFKWKPSNSYLSVIESGASALLVRFPLLKQIPRQINV